MIPPNRRVRIAAVIGGTAAVALACGCSAGPTAPDGEPSDVVDGTYLLLATSQGREPDQTTTLQVVGDRIVLTQGTDTMQATLSRSPERPIVLCPPGGSGQPSLLDVPVRVGTLELAAPALFGDCGVTRPRRITLIDLASRADGLSTFQTWVEFCDSRDPDC